MKTRRFEAGTFELRLRLRKGLQLTRGERFTLARRMGRMTQRAMADEYDVGLDTLRSWECDERDVLNEIPFVLGVRMTELPLRELLFVHRRRRGITLEEIGSALGRGTSWVHQAESGRAGAEQVVDYVLAQEEPT